MDLFGDRMKEYEKQEAGRRFIPLLPVCARIDGKCFSKFTKGLERPFDKRMTDLMCATTRYLVAETQACIGYTQSDEISLVWYSEDCKSQIFFDGRIQKMVSVLASMATAFFNQNLADSIQEKAGCMACFDCRIWQVPTLVEGANTLLWREYDATKNSISMAARHYYPHSETQDKSGDEMQEMLWQKGVNWNDYPDFFKRGSFFQKRVEKRRFSPEEIAGLPEQHHARSNPELEFERSCVVRIDMPPFAKVTNRVEVVFNGHEPIVSEETE